MKKTFARRVVKPAPNSPADIELIEFSMAPEIRESLKNALTPFLKGDKNDIDNAEELRSIVENHFPKSMIQYFERCKKQSPDTIEPRVYAILNFPEISAELISKNVPLENYDGPVGGLSEKHGKYLRQNSYAAWIQKGFGLLMEMEPFQADLIRTHNGHVQSGDLHRDEEPITAMAGIYNRGGTTTSTQFVDVAACNDRLGKKTVSNTPLFFLDEQSVQNNSIQYAVNSGAMAFWFNRGRIAHKAIPTEVNAGKLQLGDITRIVLNAFYRDISDDQKSR